MDIVTHAMAGFVVAAPLASSHPVTAACVALGSVAPDLDVLARLLGKRAFLRAHQTYSHSLPVIAALTVVGWAAWRWRTISEPWAPFALGAAMLAHVAMDASNTYGTALLWPLSKRRFSTDWIFFVDAVTLLVTAIFAVAAGCNLIRGNSSPAPAILYGCSLGAWWFFRAILARRAKRFRPEGASVPVPSALLPRRFYGYTLVGQTARLFDLNVLTGETRFANSIAILDQRHAALLATVPEYRLMRRLSAGYHVVEERFGDAAVTLVCRDLRMRNFGGTFGALEVTFDSAGNVTRKVFHV